MSLFYSFCLEFSGEGCGLNLRVEGLTSIASHGAPCKTSRNLCRGSMLWFGEWKCIFMRGGTKKASSYGDSSTRKPLGTSWNMRSTGKK